MIATKLSCPKCRRTVPEAYWQGVDLVRCPSCEGEFEQVRFPALFAARRVQRASATGDGEANCYFHQQNRAEVACDGCGRYVCSVCHVSFAGRSYCPSCLETRADRSKLPENRRVLYVDVALMLAFFPLIIWPLTLVTAPAALVLAILGWRRPGSLVGGWKRTRAVIAMIAAGVQIAGWCFVFGSMILS